MLLGCFAREDRAARIKQQEKKSQPYLNPRRRGEGGRGEGGRRKEDHQGRVRLGGEARGGAREDRVDLGSTLAPSGATGYSALLKQASCRLVHISCGTDAGSTASAPPSGERATLCESVAAIRGRFGEAGSASARSVSMAGGGAPG